MLAGKPSLRTNYPYPEDHSVVMLLNYQSFTVTRPLRKSMSEHFINKVTTSFSWLAPRCGI